ncbi:MAG TPA: hypothetical protein VFI33_16815 [Puia sp.]|nr:hypothetical protein [Puia sp.]
MNAVKFRVGDDVRIKTRTEIYDKIIATIDEISEEKGMGLCSWPGREEWMFLDDLEIVNTAAESAIF